MSRIGNAPIALEGAEVKVDGRTVTVKGPKGELQQYINSNKINIEIEDGEVLVKRTSNDKPTKSKHGLYRQLIANMIEGVTKGFSRELELYGVGYRAKNTGQLLELQLGYSHPVMFLLPDDIKVETKMEKGNPPLITLSCIDKQLLGEVAAKIKAFRKPEPYKGKGIRYRGEWIRRKEGKTAAK